MGRVTRAAVVSFVLLGAIGCSAEAESGTPEATPTVSATPSQAVRIPRQDIRVTLDPKRIVAGSEESIGITAACPVPQGGPEYRASARSDAFTELVTLLPDQGGTPESGLRGNAAIRADAKPGRYRVQVRCEATNDIGDAEFRIVASAPKRTPPEYPTKAPRAGGGGTAAGGPADGSALPVGVTVAALLAAFGVGVGVVRWRTGRHGRNGA